MYVGLFAFQNRANQEQLGLGQGLGMKQWTKRLQKVYKKSRQGEHFRPFVMVGPELTLPPGFLCTKSRLVRTWELVSEQSYRLRTTIIAVVPAD